MSAKRKALRKELMMLRKMKAERLAARKAGRGLKKDLEKMGRTAAKVTKALRKTKAISKGAKALAPLAGPFSEEISAFGELAKKVGFGAAVPRRHGRGDIHGPHMIHGFGARVSYSGIGVDAKEGGQDQDIYSIGLPPSCFPRKSYAIAPGMDRMGYNLPESGPCWAYNIQGGGIMLPGGPGGAGLMLAGMQQHTGGGLDLAGASF